MSDDVKGVFVRLPLDEAQIMKLYNPKKSGNENLLAIGTPVTGGDLYPIGYINEDAIGGLATGIYRSASIFRDEDVEHHDTVALTRLSEAIAKLAERDAEIARKDREISRLMSALYEIHKMKVAVGFKDNNISLDMRYLALETLKGQEA